MLKSYAWIFFISMIPLIELRGAVPVSQLLDLPVLQSYIICILGNFFPVPFIYLFARRFLEWGQDKKFIGNFASFCLEKGSAAGKNLEKKAAYGIFAALVLFVGIPLPGTGAWTGTLAASILNLGLKKTCLAVISGLLLAGFIMMAGSVGIANAVN